MLQEKEPQDFVISTGEMHSVREFVEMSFSHINKTIRWEGKAEDEVGIEVETGIVRVKINKKYYRPTEVVSSLILNIIFVFLSNFNSSLGSSIGWFI